MRRCRTDLVVKAYVNEVPVLQARRVQDGAKVTVQLLATDQVVVRRPAPTAEHTGKHVGPAAPASTRTRAHNIQHRLWLPYKGLYDFWHTSY